MPELDFDTQNYKGEFKIQAIPAGRYKMVIADSQRKNAKSGNGALMVLTLEVVEGDCKGAKVWVNLNLWNTSERAVRIAREELTAIAHAVNIPSPRCTEEMHDIPFFADVEQEQDANSGTIRNRVTAYYSIRRRPQDTAQAPAPGASDIPPYRRSATGQTWGQQPQQPPRPPAPYADGK